LPLALKWIRRALYQTVLSSELLGIAISKELSQIPAAVRNGNGIASAVSRSLNYSGACNVLACHAIRQQPFLLELQKRLETPEGGAAALTRLAALRASLFQPAKMNVVVAADLTALTSPYADLAEALLPPANPPAFGAIAQDAHTAPVASGPLGGLRDVAIRAHNQGASTVVSLSAIESNFLIASNDGIGPYSPDHAALLVAIEYLTALEGDFWVKLRGAGLTYSYGIRMSTDSEMVSFTLFKCADLVNAYAAAKKIVADYASGASTMGAIDLEGAKSTVAYSIIAGTSTRLSAAAAAWESQYMGKGVDYGKWLLTEVDQVEVSDALHALKKYIVPLFDASANLAATCPPAKLDVACDGLEAALGVPVRRLTEEQLFSAFDPPADESTKDGVAAKEAVGPTQSIPTSKKAATAFSFAKQFKCECPKCVVPPVSAL